MHDEITCHAAVEFVQLKCIQNFFPILFLRILMGPDLILTLYSTIDTQPTMTSPFVAIVTDKMAA